MPFLQCGSEQTVKEESPQRGATKAGTYRRRYDEANRSTSEPAIKSERRFRQHPFVPVRVLAQPIGIGQPTPLGRNGF
jgi:hypothetical protein